jgi:hypothetical protein
MAKDQYDPGDLKKRLMDFVMSGRFRTEFKRAVREKFGGDTIVGDEQEMVNFMDWFALERRTRDGRTPLEVFVQRERKRGMPESVAQQLSRWSDITESLFEVREKVDPDTVLAYDHLRQRELTIKCNIPGFLSKKVSLGSYLIARIVPWYDHYYLSGASAVFPPESKKKILEIARDMSREHPGLAYASATEEEREKLAAMEEEMYHAFVQFFGDDEVVFATGREMAKKLEEFTRYQIFEHVQASGKTMAQEAEERGHKAKMPQQAPYPRELLKARDIGVLLDPVEGMFLLPEYDTFRHIFAEPDFQQIPGWRELIYNYLKEESVPPLPFERMVERYPEGARRVFKAALRRRRFNLKRDFPKLMRRYKRSWLEKEPVPTVIPFR